MATIYNVALTWCKVSERNMNRTDSVLWQSPYIQRNPKNKVTAKEMPTFIQRLPTNLGRYFGVTAVTPLVWLNRFTSAQPSDKEPSL